MLISTFALGELPSLAGGEWLVPPAEPRRPLPPICTDTRTLRSGDIFLALRGPNFDGHSFLPQALLKCAGGLIVDRPESVPPCYPPVPVLCVPEALRALGNVAHALRRKANAHGAIVAGVAGSCGKTTTKELLADIASAEDGAEHVLRSPLNHNNLIGVPQTLLGFEAHHHRAVVEAGMNQPGELARLAEILSPDVAILTNIGTAHRGMFASAEEHFRAKFDWLAGVPPWASIVVNGDCPRAREAGAAVRRPRRVFYYGEGHPESVARVFEIEPIDPLGYRFRFSLFGEILTAELPLFGAYNISNALGAAVAARLMGISEGAIVEGLRATRPMKLRGDLCELAERMLVVDCYNAAPEAMLRALDSACQLAARRKARVFALLGDMGELGPLSEEAHRSVGRRAAELGYAGLYTVGAEMRHACAEAAAAGVSVHPCEAVTGAALAAMKATRPGDVILIKGSRALELEDALPVMSAWARTEAKSLLAKIA